VVRVTGASNKRVSLAALIAIKPGCRTRCPHLSTPGPRGTLTAAFCFRYRPQDAGVCRIEHDMAESVGCGGWKADGLRRELGQFTNADYTSGGWTLVPPGGG
jgi:hypothetical protein